MVHKVLSKHKHVNTPFDNTAAVRSLLCGGGEFAGQCDFPPVASCPRTAGAS